MSSERQTAFLALQMLLLANGASLSPALGRERREEHQTSTACDSMSELTPDELDADVDQVMEINRLGADVLARYTPDGQRSDFDRLCAVSYLLSGMMVTTGKHQGSPMAAIIEEHGVALMRVAIAMRRYMKARGLKSPLAALEGR